VIASEAPENAPPIGVLVPSMREQGVAHCAGPPRARHALADGAIEGLSNKELDLRLVAAVELIA
jgi:hypothetical protein